MLEVLRKRQGSTYGRYRLFFFGAKIHKIVGGEKEMEIKNSCRFACMRFYRESFIVLLCQGKDGCTNRNPDWQSIARNSQKIGGDCCPLVGS